MDKPKSPCKKDCEYRSANCHNESCPHGWAEYEVAYQRFLKEPVNLMGLGTHMKPMTDATRRLIHRNAMINKRKGK